MGTFQRKGHRTSWPDAQDFDHLEHMMGSQSILKDGISQEKLAMDEEESTMHTDAESLPKRHDIAWGNHPKKQIPLRPLAPPLWKSLPKF